MYIEIESVESKEIINGYQAKFIHTEKMTFAFWDVKKGAVMPIHHHMHEQVSQVLEGQFELTVNGQSNLCKPGFITLISSNSPHGGVAITDCRILDTFSPPREDYK